MAEKPNIARAHIAEQLISKSWAELQALEHPVTGHLLFPDQIFRRRADGSCEKKRIMLRVPREPDLRAARRTARAWADKESIDETRDPDMFANMEAMCVLAIAIRNDSEPFEPWVSSPVELEAQWDRGSLMQVYARLDDLTKLIDPAADDITEQEMLMLVYGIARDRNILPLRAFGSGSQTSFIVSMATMLASFLGSMSSSESSAALTPE